MSDTSNDESSSDTETEYIKSTDKLDPKSLAIKPVKPNKRKIQQYLNESDLDDDDEDLPTYTNTELLSQILKNLEDTNKSLCIEPKEVTENHSESDKQNEKPDKYNDSIRKLLLQGETNLDTSTASEASFYAGTTSTVNQEPEKSASQSSIEIVCPYSNNLLRSRAAKKKQSLQDVLRNQLNKKLRAHQLLVHKVGILCWLAHGFYLNRLINNPEILAVALSLVSPANYPQETIKINYLIKFTVWFKKNFQLNKHEKRDATNKSELLKALETKVVKDEKELVLLYTAILRAMGIKCRLVISLCPPERIVKKEKLIMPENSDNKEATKSTKTKVAPAKKSTKSAESKSKKVACYHDSVVENTQDGISRKRLEAKQKAAAILNKIKVAKSALDESKEKTKTNVRSKLKQFEKQSSKDTKAAKTEKTAKEKNSKSKTEKEQKSEIEYMETDEESDYEFQEEKNTALTKFANKTNSKGTKLLSSDEDEGEKQDEMRTGNYWTEIYLDSENSWVSADVMTGKINASDDIYKRAQKPVLYVVAWNTDGLIKDVTRRYCPRWLTLTRKQRISDEWWDDAVHSFKEKRDAASKAEDELLLKRELELPLPKTISECKGHPLYAIPRHLLKYEALYPPDIIPLGYLPNGEPIYPRFCVHTLMSRQTWLKHARVVKPAQEPYKIVKSMPKYDKMTGSISKDLDLELFGKWQTDPYIPPTATDGVVPRNEFGNVDLFKKSMLPHGTVHIDLPGLARVARKLNIDCAPAVVGFNFGNRGATPATEGYIVCTEYEDVLRDAWKTEQVEAEKRARQRREKEIYGNWKRIIKGLMIRKRLAYKYDISDGKDELQKKPETQETMPCKKKKI